MPPLADDVEQIEDDIGKLQVSLAELGATFRGHDEADKARHAEVMAGQHRIEHGQSQLVRYMLAAVVVMAILNGALVAGSLALDVPGVGGVRLGSDAQAAQMTAP